MGTTTNKTGYGSDFITVLVGTVTCLLVLSVVWLFDHSERLRAESHLITTITGQAADMRARIEQNLNARLLLADGLAAQVGDDGKVNPVEFLSFGRAATISRNDIRALEMAPGGIIRHVYPLNGNEKVLGLDLRKLHGQRQAVERTIAERRFVVAGPVNLRQGGRGVIGRKPIFLPRGIDNVERSTFWGFAIIVIDFDALMAVSGWLETGAEYRMALRGKGGTGAAGEVFLGDADIFKANPVTTDIVLPNGTWQLGAAPVRGLDARRGRRRQLWLAGTVIAALLAFATGVLAKMYYKQKDVEASLRKASGAKDKFLANVSHELRTPLNAIIGFSGVLANESLGPHGNPKYGEYARDIENSGHHLLDLINTILDLEKIKAGRMNIHPESLDPRAEINENVRMLSEEARKKGVELRIDCICGSLRLFADRRSFKQMLLNLLSNAIKFTESGGVITVGCGIDDNGLCIHITDTGIGIAPEYMDKIMLPFEQGGDAHISSNHGTGLGLSLTKHLIEMHDGRLIIKSRPGDGTTATLVFPHTRVESFSPS